MNGELPDVQAGFRKGRGTRCQIANIHWIRESKGFPEKHLLLLHWLCESLCVDHSKPINWKYQTTLPISWETCMQVKKQQLEPWMELLHNGKRSTTRLYNCHLVYFLCKVYHAKCWAGWITSWNQDCWEKYQQPQICTVYHFNDRKWRETIETLD